MLPQEIRPHSELRSEEPPFRRGEARHPKAFPKRDERRKVPKQIEQESLQALSHLLSAQKKAQTALVQQHNAIFQLQTQEAKTKAARIEGNFLSTQIAELHDTLIETLIHTNQTGIQETILLLRSDPLSSSPLNGAKITITEYSTAPKIFNIHLAAPNAEGLSLFVSHTQELLTALKKNNHSFDIHRIDASVLTSRRYNPNRGREELLDQENG